MGQLVICIDASESSGLLREGEVYTVTDCWHCSCAKWLHVEEPSRILGARRGCCIGCQRMIPSVSNGWFWAKRFVPLNDPDLKERPEDYRTPIDEMKECVDYLAQKDLPCVPFPMPVEEEA